MWLLNGGHVEVLKFLVQHSPICGAAILHTLNILECTPAMDAASHGHVNVLEYLVEHTLACKRREVLTGIPCGLLEATLMR